ncbi:MAG: type II secretion system protein [Clostridia bacterium]|nr:type II secretion system protein [Clostridia bacterium]
MQNKRVKNGFTMSEALVTVAIVAVLAGVIIVSVFSYLRSLTKREYDGYAREIFVSAQNHLSMSGVQGYLGRSDFGIEEPAVAGAPDTGDGVYYFVVCADKSALSDDASLLSLMLPFASVDETLRLGGCYIVRYHKDTARVLDVFYWDGGDGRYKHDYSASDYEEFIKNRGDSGSLRNYGSGGAVIGYYGGASADGLTRGEELSAPAVVIDNANKLNVTVTDFNRNTDSTKTVANAQLKLIIAGDISGSSREITLDPGAVAYVTDPAGYYVYTVTLDDVTSPGKQFAVQFCSAASGNLIPGEDISVQAVAFNNTELTNIAYSARQKTNSLFAYGGGASGAAFISSPRHLLNLDPAVSAFAYGDTRHYFVDPSGKVSAAQTANLSWGGFTSGYIYGVGPLSQGNEQLTSEAGTYRPVTAGYALDYEGNGHSVAGITVVTSSEAGMFGELSGGSVQNLELIGFSVSGSESGALAGVAYDADITNVLVRESGTSSAGVTGSGDAGGLVGSAQSNCVIAKCASAITVRSTGGNAGGLAGVLSQSTAGACYSAGHTENGEYSKTAYNVVSASGSAGGLFGTVRGSEIRYCYSTCSAKGAAAGGFAGTLENTAVRDCYSAGTVSGTSTEGAFAATVSGTVSFSACRYFKIVNGREAAGGGYVYLDPLASGLNANITAFDENAETYNAWTGAVHKTAHAYDAVLVRWYHGAYGLKTVEQLGASVSAGDFVAEHYGDWPSPETRVINEK